MRFRTNYQLKYPSLLLACLVVSISLQLLVALFGQSVYWWEEKLTSLAISLLTDIAVFLHYRFPTRPGAIVLQVLVVLSLLLLIGSFVLVTLLFSSSSSNSLLSIQFIAIIMALLVFHGLLLVSFHVKRVTEQSMVEENSKP
ncbi:hypothetical protein G5B88_21240 [Herbaspirillum seropedicae]|uniref:hypothetical protein n=1 Tax=Herbaspirillum seropedicae TaxID=964 RepID=UPI00059CD60E|nr:hypothetical protein [Herbaspirillum seropedicae]AKN67475.1 hypothetical protein ACP92_20920 [Herbaspirillum seropedicae]NQE32064.1 hypothetical protein [Herbaspirillum seropedicae]UMU23483.1 hypothetical protein G5B88_21240 [Herbaspirillum seropedicae]